MREKKGAELKGTWSRSQNSRTGSKGKKGGDLILFWYNLMLIWVWLNEVGIQNQADRNCE